MANIRIKKRDSKAGVTVPKVDGLEDGKEN